MNGGGSQVPTNLVSVPVLPGMPITIAQPPVSPLAGAPEIATAARADVAEAAWPDLDPAFVGMQARRARAAIEAATPPPLDPEGSPVDRWALDSVPALAEREQEAAPRVRQAERAALDAARALAALARPWGLASRVGIASALALGCVLASGAVAGLLAGGINAIFARPILLAVWGGGRRDLILYVSFAQSFGMAGALLGLQLIATLVALGSLGGRKWVFVLVDLSFSAAFAIMRGGHAVLPSVAAGLFEGALLSAASLALAAVDGRLKDDAARAGPYRIAQARLAVEDRELEAVRRAHAESRAELAAQIAAIASREGLVRTLGPRRALAEETARVAVVTSTAGGIAKAIDGSAEDALTKEVAKELEAAHRDYRKTVDDGRYR